MLQTLTFNSETYQRIKNIWFGDYKMPDIDVKLDVKEFKHTKYGEYTYHGQVKRKTETI